VEKGVHGKNWFPGKVRRADQHAAASFCSYTDEWPDAETAASVMRAGEIPAAGLTQFAIEGPNDAANPQNRSLPDSCASRLLQTRLRHGTARL
jgi:hypothetical protein